MNKRQVTVLWIIAIVLVGALVAVNSSKKDGYQSATKRARGETLIEDFPASDITRLSITHGEKSVNLKKGENGWVVSERDDYPANTPNINDLLRSLTEVKVTQGIEADPEFAPRFGMDPVADDDAEKGTLVVLGNTDGTSTEVTFGRNLESGSGGGPMGMGGGSAGRFVRLHSDDSGIYVTSDLFPTLTTEIGRWLDDRFIKVEKIKTVSVSKPGKENEIDWKLTRADENAEFELEGKKDIENLDPNAINPIKNLFSYARFEDVVPAADAESGWDEEKSQSALIETVEGFTYKVVFGPKKKAEGETEDLYLMQIEVTADIPKQRKKAEDESEEDSKAKDEAFASRRKDLEDQLADSKKLEGRTYQVTKFTVDALLKDRIGLIMSAPPAQPQTGGATTNGQPFPARPVAPPQPRRKVQAVTPPIAVPPLPKKDEEAPE